MIIFLILFLFTTTAKAEVYEWKVLRTVDGDSLEIANQFLPEELKLFVRMKGIDTPEKAPSAKCEKENALGQKATIFTPCWPNAGPTGGAGVALPADSANFNNATSFFAIIIKNNILNFYFEFLNPFY